jgi:hypothetical protein
MTDEITSTPETEPELKPIPEDEQPQKKLTLRDPVDGKTLAKFKQLQDARLQLGDRLLTLKEEEIQALAASRELKKQHQILFEALLTERGLPVDTFVNIEARTGEITLQKSEQKVTAPKAPEEAPEEA